MSNTSPPRDDYCKAALEFLTNYYEDRGVPPSYRQIGDHLGLMSSSSVAHHIVHLVEDGFLLHRGDRGVIPNA